MEKAGISAWLDERELYPGQSWQEAIEETLESVRAIAVIISASGLGPWEVPEMRAALILAVDRKLPVIPVLLPGTPPDVKLPLFLRQFTWADLRDGIHSGGILRIKAGIDRKRVVIEGTSLLRPARVTETIQPLRVDEVLLRALGYLTLWVILKCVPQAIRGRLPTFHEARAQPPHRSDAA